MEIFPMQDLVTIDKIEDHDEFEMIGYKIYAIFPFDYTPDDALQAMKYNMWEQKSTLNYQKSRESTYQQTRIIPVLIDRFKKNQENEIDDIIKLGRKLIMEEITLWKSSDFQRQILCEFCNKYRPDINDDCSCQLVEKKINY